jgi:hypothetical protein
VWGYPFPQLQVVAIKLLSIHQANGPSERDWSGRGITKSKLRNKMSGPKHDKVHNVRQWLQTKADKVARAFGNRYGPPEFDLHAICKLAPEFPGPPVAYSWESSMSAEREKDFEREFAEESDDEEGSVSELDTDDEFQEPDQQSDQCLDVGSDTDSDWEP